MSHNGPPISVLGSTRVERSALRRCGDCAVEDAGGTAVEAIGVTVVYARSPALCDIELAIAEGEIVALMGPNGAGKSTLLKCLIGAVRPAKGRVCWFGSPSLRRSSALRQIGFVGPEMGLYAELSAVENLRFAGRMYGVANVKDRVARILADGGLETHAERPVGQLSQGMRQRVAILRAVVHEPRFLALDEPSANLDARGRDWLERLLQQWRSAGRAVCFASHDAAQCRALSNRIVHLDAGRIVPIENGACPAPRLQRSA